MKITDFLSRETIVPALASREKNAALEEMAGYLGSTHQLDKNKVLKVLLER